MLLDCINTKNIILEKALKKSNKFKKKNFRRPKLAVLLMSDDPASKVYVNNKEKVSEKPKVNTTTFTFDEHIKQEEIELFIKNMVKDKIYDGIMIQSPVYKHLDYDKLVNLIPKECDVDGLTLANKNDLYNNKKAIIPCTAYGVMELLNHNVDLIGTLENKNVVIINRSDLVGNPLDVLLKRANANVTVLHSKTSRKNLISYLKNADIVISAVGKENFIITKDMLSDNKKQILVDVGIKRSVIDNKTVLKGDFDESLLEEENYYCTKTPGGTAQLTLASLMYNTCISAELNKL